MAQNVTTFLDQLTSIVSPIFKKIGVDPQHGQVRFSDRRDLGQFQCNGAMAAASLLKKPPRQIAEDVAAFLRKDPRFGSVNVAGPGFINLTISGSYLAERIAQLQSDAKLGCGRSRGKTIVIDFGGLNVAKAMHVGHLRSLIIGDCLQRLFRFVGDNVISDVHLGDWGLQMGMLIDEICRRNPQLPYFDPYFNGEYPKESPVTLDDLQEIYPQASANCKANPELLDRARLATQELQAGREGYRKLWEHFIAVSHRSLENDLSRLGVSFDLWEGESTVSEQIPHLVERLTAEGTAIRSEGALIIPIERSGDKKNMPPLILLKSDGAMLYSTTDLAAIKSRVDRFAPDHIIYVVDQRQHLHFEQVFRAAEKSRLVRKTTLEHIGFGTINGPDGKPFKTRAGGTMRLGDLLELAHHEAAKRLDEAELATEYTEAERGEIARRVGIASIKYADLMNHRLSDYVFDISRFTRFEGKTGPYVMYASVRIKSVLRKAAQKGIVATKILPAVSDNEMSLMLQLLLFCDAVRAAYEERAPHHLCEYVYFLAQEFSRFYHECPIITEADEQRRGSYLSLLRITLATFERVLDLLGIDVPERM
jgi:arginyl-tRNA synthetase